MLRFPWAARFPEVSEFRHTRLRVRCRCPDIMFALAPLPPAGLTQSDLRDQWTADADTKLRRAAAGGEKRQAAGGGGEDDGGGKKQKI